MVRSVACEAALAAHKVADTDAVHSLLPVEGLRLALGFVPDDPCSQRATQPAGLAPAQQHASPARQQPAAVLLTDSSRPGGGDAQGSCSSRGWAKSRRTQASTIASVNRMQKATRAEWDICGRQVGQRRGLTVPSVISPGRSLRHTASLLTKPQAVQAQPPSREPTKLKTNMLARCPGPQQRQAAALAQLPGLGLQSRQRTKSKLACSTGAAGLHCSAGRPQGRDAQLLMPKHLFLGYEVPLPASDIYTALLTVAGFLPAVVLLHHTAAFLLRIGHSLWQGRPGRAGKQD